MLLHRVREGEVCRSGDLCDVSGVLDNELGYTEKDQGSAVSVYTYKVTSSGSEPCHVGLWVFRAAEWREAGHR